MKEIKGGFLGEGLKITIVISRFNEFISNELIGGCLDTLKKTGVKDSDISVVWVPGSYEIPQVLSKINSDGVDAIITLGAVIRGDTPHFDFIASEVAKGVANISINKKVPIIFGVITADTVEQAIERSGTKHGNKGRDAALSALEMANIYRQI